MTRHLQIFSFPLVYLVTLKKFELGMKAVQQLGCQAYYTLDMLEGSLRVRAGPPPLPTYTGLGDGFYATVPWMKMPGRAGLLSSKCFLLKLT